MKGHKGGYLCVPALATAGGILWGLSALVLGLIAQNGGYGSELVEFLGQFYLGYETTVGGAFIGLVWAFIDAFIGLAIFGWLYNLIVGKCGCTK